jgi:hypothetical protein
MREGRLPSRCARPCRVEVRTALSRRGAPTCACRGASRRGAGLPRPFERRRRDPRRARPRRTPTGRGGRDKSALHGSTTPVANPEGACDSRDQFVELGVRSGMREGRLPSRCARPCRVEVRTALSRRGAPTCACRGASRRGAGLPRPFERRRRGPRRARPRRTPTGRGGRDKSALHGSTTPVANPGGTCAARDWFDECEVRSGMREGRLPSRCERPCRVEVRAALSRRGAPTCACRGASRRGAGRPRPFERRRRDPRRARPRRTPTGRGGRDKSALHGSTTPVANPGGTCAAGDWFDECEVRSGMREGRLPARCERPCRVEVRTALSRRGAPTCACRGASRRGAGLPRPFERRRRDPRRARPRRTPTGRGGRDKSALHGSTTPVANPEGACDSRDQSVFVSAPRTRSR